MIFCNSAKRSIQLRELLVINKAAVKEAILQGRPGLDGDLIQAAIFQHTVTTCAELIIHIHINAGLDHGGMHNTELQLIGANRHIQGILQQLHLIGVLIGNAKMPHLACFLQMRKCPCHLFRLH